LLRAYMEEDDRNPDSSNDFGKNIIPAMLGNGEKMYAYPFEGYWKDVGTVQSLWEANMDLIADPPLLKLDDPSWRIYSKTMSLPAHVVGKNAEIRNSLVTEGSVVNGTVRHSVLFGGSVVEDGAFVEDSVVFPGAVIKRGTRITKAIIGENSVIGENCVIGGPLREGEKVDNKLTGDIALIGNDITVDDGVYMPQGAIASVN
ncbi:MAG: glucose-1-phosphate adenylyltransferase, partial [Clostridia bacterium]|nr:glucose-1-phosphate adenylyltransferase [Clostridia bacterium]